MDGMGDEGQLERRIVSVLFADLVGFTPLSERLDAEDVAAIQDAYFAAVRETVTRYGGRLEKFIGDAAVAAFGLPRARDDDPERAARAGLAIVSAVDQLAARLGLAPGELQVRVGIQTGEIVHMTGGPDAGRMTGDTVNTAARLQTAAPPGGVLLGEPTALAVADVAHLEPVEPLTLKGKAEPVRASLLTAFRPERSRDAAMGRLRAPTVGRDAELAVLREAIARLRERAAGTERWMVVAPPGVGKTRLLAEIAGDAEAAGIAVSRIRVRHEPEAPFGPVADLVRAALGGSDVPAAAIRERLAAAGIEGPRLAFVADELERLLDATTASGATAVPRDARFEAWLDGFDAITGSRRSVWLVEDLHWASPDLVAFVLAAGGHEGAPRLILATTRPSLIERSPACGVDDAAARQRLLDLQPLPAGDAALLVERLVGDALPPALVERIAERADGNPLFIEELLRGWVSSGSLVLDGETWRLALPPETIPLPATVQAIYAAQLDDLPDAARSAARRASVSGRRFPIDALGALDVPEADTALEVLLRRAIVGDADADPIGGRSVAYRHALLRDAGYASLARAERAVLHLRLARWLEATAGDEAGSIGAALGTHWELAVSNAPALATEIGDGVDRATARATAAAWLERGAGTARELAAHESAVDLLRRAIDLTDAEDVPATARRLVALGDAERFADLGRAAEAYQRATDLLAPLVGEGAAARLAYSQAASSLSDVLFEGIGFAAADAAAATAQDVLGSTPDAARLRVDIRRNRTVVGLDNDNPAALRRADAILEAARATGDEDLIREAFRERVGSAHEADVVTPEEWEAVAREAEAAGDVQGAIEAATNRALLLLITEPTAVHAAADAVAPLIEAHRLHEDACWLDMAHAEADLLLGTWDDALDRGSRVLDVGTRRGFNRAVVRTLFCVVPVAGRRGDRAFLEQALGWYDARRGIFPASPYGLLNHEGSDVQFRANGLLPDEPADLERMRAGLALGESGPSTLSSMEAVVDEWLRHSMLDTAAEAIAVMDAAGTARNRLGEALLALLRARFARAAGSDDGASVAALATHAAELARPIPAPWWLARALRIVAETSPDRGAAARAGGEAHELETRLGISAASTVA